MPYITPAEKIKLFNAVEHIPNDLTPGQLTYVITRILIRQISGLEPSYATFNSLMGCLECAKQELYRRVIAPYEDAKMLKNGDVYGKT
jgi:hypothetical protein